ncbi:MAG: hypothetical protein RSB72_02750, partial [Bacilli bacterium]
MKKVSLFFLLIIIISVLNMLVTKEKTTAVFKDLSNEHYLLQQANNYNIVYLDVSLVDISTKNYNTIKKLSILGVYYFINPFISNKFITNYYEFRYDNI